jgi:integrase
MIVSMGEIIRRGTRSNPRYFFRYYEADGTRRMKLAKGADTKAKALDVLREVEVRVQRGLIGVPERVASQKCGPLMDEWIKTIDNRNARDDANRYQLHLRPHWAEVIMEKAQEVRPVMAWLDQQKKAGKLSSGSTRHNLNLLSRFFSWAIEQGHAKVNPVRMIPTGKRPHQPTKRDVPWIESDDVIIALITALPEPVNMMFYLGNRCGLRTGEIAGLRMGDMDYLRDGAILVRYSYDGPLKEDRHGAGKVKWAPAPDDAEEQLGVWLKRRKLQGAQPEDLVFVAPPSPKNPRKSAWKGYRKENLEDIWDAARGKVNTEALAEGVTEPPVAATLTWYQATRHSFVSRNLKAGAGLDEVSSAIGHASTTTTRQHYDHYVRKTFSPTLTRRLGAK